MPAEKALPRKAAVRTREALRTTIGRLPDASDPAERRNYPENSVDASDAADMLWLFDPAVWWYGEPPCGGRCAMGQLLRGSATTTEAVRRALQLRQESVRALAKRYGLGPTTVQKWRRRTTTADARMGPKEVRSTVLTLKEEVMVVAFRRHTLLPL